MQFKGFAALAAVFALSGCAVWETDYPDTLTADVTANWHIDDVNVFVTDELSSSDENRFFIDADIVWHGELAGDRKAQVHAILEEGITEGSKSLSGPKHVELDVRLVEFHAVTPRSVSRAPAAVHNIRWVVHARDTYSGEIIAGPDLITAQFEAYTGAYAAVAAAEGRGQRARIVNHIARVTAGWLATGPDIRREFVSLGR